MACGISTPHEHVQYADLPGVPYSTPCKHASPSCLASCLICIQCLTCMPYNLSSKHAAPARLAALLISMPPMRVPPARLVACPVSLLHRHASYRALLSVAYQPALWLSPSRTPSTPLSSLSVYIYITRPVLHHRHRCLRPAQRPPIPLHISAFVQPCQTSHLLMSSVYMAYGPLANGALACRLRICIPLVLRSMCRSSLWPVSLWSTAV